MTDEARYDMRAIRELLEGGFSIEDLHGLFLSPRSQDLRPVAGQFAPGDGKPAMVRKAIEYCIRFILLDELLAEAEEANPRAYARFGPYRVAEGEQPATEPASGGRVARQDPRYTLPRGAGGDTIVLSGNHSHFNVNINAILDHTTQSIGAIPHADDALKEELERLVQELQSALQQAPPEQAEEAAAVAEFAEELVEGAKEEKPNKFKLRISADGLKKAAENLAKVVPPVLGIATQIAETIIRLTGAG